MSPSDNASERRENRVKKGRKYERLAASYFEQQGFSILERNWRAASKEIDFIARKDNLIIFVEVKSANTKQFGHPAERVNKQKIMHLTNAAQQYLITKKIQDSDLRFDVITFTNGSLEHYPNAFEVEE